MNSPAEVGQQNDIVVVSDLHMVYRVGKVKVPALRGLDLNIRRGEFVAVMGPSGCGKSTLLHLIGGLLRPTSGRIVIDGSEISSAGDAERTEVRRRKVGFVFQRFNLLPTLSAHDNIELARRIHGENGAQDGSSVQEILQFLGLEDKLVHRPFELSGGEQQRVAIARAIINRPAILLADEPTGSLDSENSQMVLEKLQELNVRYHQTIIMITHNPEAAASAGRIIEMKDGRIVSRPRNPYYAMEQKLF